MSEHVVIAKTRHFEVRVPNLPHIPRDEGGHIFVEALSGCENRWEMSEEESIECAWLVTMTGEAYKTAMEKRGVPLYKLNFQDNGNWAYVDGKTPTLHIHIYGRALCEKDGNAHQGYGQALVFPWRDSGYYDDFDSITIDDVNTIASEMVRLADSERYMWDAIDKEKARLEFPNKE